MATSKKTVKAKSTKRGSKGHIEQIDAGWYGMAQGGNEVGQTVVVTVSGGTTEYYFLYQSGYGGGQGKYTYPGKSTCPIATTMSYNGALPTGWTTPAAYQAGLLPIVAQLVTAKCTVSSTAKKKKPAARRK